MNEATQKNREPIKQERVTLKEGSLQKLDAWIRQIDRDVSGVRITRSDLINWLLDEHQELLTGNELASIRTRFFDEIEFTSWALKRLKDARKNGLELSLNDFLPKPAKPERKKRVSKNSTNTL